MDDPDTALARLASRQHGVLCRSQALALGLTTDHLRHRLSTGLLERVHDGVDRHAAAPATAEARFAAAVLAAGPDAVASHRSAGRLHGLRDVHRVAAGARRRPAPTGRCAPASTCTAGPSEQQPGVRSATSTALAPTAAGRGRVDAGLAQGGGDAGPDRHTHVAGEGGGEDLDVEGWDPARTEPGAGEGGEHPQRQRGGNGHAGGHGEHGRRPARPARLRLAPAGLRSAGSAGVRWLKRVMAGSAPSVRISSTASAASCDGDVELGALGLARAAQHVVGALLPARAACRRRCAPARSRRCGGGP